MLRDDDAHLCELYTVAYWLTLALRHAVLGRMPLHQAEFATLGQRLLKNLPRTALRGWGPRRRKGWMPHGLGTLTARAKCPKTVQPQITTQRISEDDAPSAPNRSVRTLEINDSARRRANTSG